MHINLVKRIIFGVNMLLNGPSLVHFRKRVKIYKQDFISKKD